MKIKQKTNQKKIWVIAVASTVVIIGSLMTYLVFANGGGILPVNETSDTSQPSADSNDPEQRNESKPSQKIVPPHTDHASPLTSDESTGKQVLPMVVSSTVDGTVIYIRGGLNTPETEGICYAVLTGPNGESIRKDTALLPNAGTTDCKTISIPISELSTGKWSVTLNYSSNNSEGESSASSFTIK